MSKSTQKSKAVQGASKSKLSSTEKAAATFEKLQAMIKNYDPYAVFNDRKGCVFAVGVSIMLIVIFILNAVMNGNWLSLVFVPIYLLIIRNRLRKLREMAGE